MRIVKFKKFISWNVISLIGYLSLVIVAYFTVVLLLSVSEIGMRVDLNKYFYEYIVKHVIFPYLDFYKIQLGLIFLLLICSKFEDKYYRREGKLGLHLFEHHQNFYSAVFITGLILNICPMYLLILLILKISMMMH